jgi:hypothetical protein
MEYKVIYGGSPKELTDKVNDYLKDGWEIVGSHQVVVMYSQNQFRGDQHINTRNEIEYSQTLIKNNNGVI